MPGTIVEMEPVHGVGIRIYPPALQAAIARSAGLMFGRLQQVQPHIGKTGLFQQQPQPKVGARLV